MVRRPRKEGVRNASSTSEKARIPRAEKKKGTKKKGRSWGNDKEDEELRMH